MNHASLAALCALAAFAPLSLAQAQTNPHAGMSMQDHAAMQKAPGATGIITTPSDNAMLSAAPEAFTATFPHAMTLKSLKLTGPASETAEIQVSASATPGTTVSAPLPRLAPGNYTAAWTATGSDGHEMSGAVRFMVH